MVGAQTYFGRKGKHFDRGLGRWIESKEHRREVCNELGCVPLDGDVDFAKSAAQARAPQEKLAAEGDALVEKIENHPAFQEYRKDRASGKLADRLKHIQHHGVNVK